MYSKSVKKSGKVYRKRDKIKRELFEKTCVCEILDATEPSTSFDYTADQTSRTSSSEDEQEKPNDAINFHNMDVKERLKFWALSTNQSHHSVNMILKIIRNEYQADIPHDARTLLQTNRTPANIKDISGGKFWYHGIEKCLSNYFGNNRPPFPELSINIFVDGLPLYKSSSTQLWPILINLHNMPNVSPMVVGVFCGAKKPGNVEEYLASLVEELKIILHTGINIRGTNISIKLRAIIADSPARAFIKGVAYFNATNGCLKCTCEGEYSHESHTMIFKGVNHTKRTDNDFRQKAYGKHHKVASPLLDIPFLDIIRDIIIADRLHLIDLGVMKRLMLGWRDGTLGLYSKLSASDIIKISDMLRHIKLPSEIHRPFRNLNVLKYWKASEFSSFLHYGGIVVLKDILPEDVYNHFLLLFCAVTMLSTNFYKQNWHVAKEMITEFVIQYSDIYGDRFLTSNVHNLLHIFDEVEFFGSLNTISTYHFENKLQHLKKLLRSRHQDLQQLINRLSELECFHTYEREQHSNDDGINFKMQDNNRDGWVLTKQQKIVRYTKMHSKSPSAFHGRVLQGQRNYFEFPFKSSVLNIFVGKVSETSKPEETIKFCNIRCKLVAIETRESGVYVFIPLVHTLK